MDKTYGSSVGFGKLREEFPELYSDMCFECGPGWYDLLYDLSLKIKEHLQECSHISQGEDACEFYPTQIKEKYGTLRYYVSCACDKISSLIDEAQKKSRNICENCGEKGQIEDLHGWLYTRCEQCFRKLKH